MSVHVPEGWVEVSEAGFDEYLKQCPDYRQDGFGFVYLKHNGQMFALSYEGKRYVDPQILEL